MMVCHTKKCCGQMVFEPTCASCTVGSYASLSVCLWQKLLPHIGKGLLLWQCGLIANVKLHFFNITDCLEIASCSGRSRGSRGTKPWGSLYICDKPHRLDKWATFRDGNYICHVKLQTVRLSRTSKNFRHFSERNAEMLEITLCLFDKDRQK